MKYFHTHPQFSSQSQKSYVAFQAKFTYPWSWRDQPHWLHETRNTSQPL